MFDEKRLEMVTQNRRIKARMRLVVESVILLFAMSQSVSCDPVRTPRPAALIPRDYDYDDHSMVESSIQTCIAFNTHSETRRKYGFARTLTVNQLKNKPGAEIAASQLTGTLDQTLRFFCRRDLPFRDVAPDRVLGERLRWAETRRVLTAGPARWLVVGGRSIAPTRRSAVPGSSVYWGSSMAITATARAR